MKIVIVSDVHGEIQKMYKNIHDYENENGEFDAIVQLGDFKAIRNSEDLRFLNTPEKYRTLGEFPGIYKRGDVSKPTYFIGGNHDNDFWHSDNPLGYELVENLFYLGRSGVKQIGETKFAFVSGNYAYNDFYSVNKRKSKKYHHYTKEDLENISGKEFDVLLLHDWPSVTQMAKYMTRTSSEETLETTVKRKFGSEEMFELIKKKQPKFVFAGHIHMYLEIDMDFRNSITRFIGLSKFNNPNSVCLFDSDKESVEIIK